MITRTLIAIGKAFLIYIAAALTFPFMLIGCLCGIAGEEQLMDWWWDNSPLGYCYKYFKEVDES